MHRNAPRCGGDVEVRAKGAIDDIDQREDAGNRDQREQEKDETAPELRLVTGQRVWTSACAEPHSESPVRDHNHQTWPIMNTSTAEKSIRPSADAYPYRSCS